MANAAKAKGSRAERQVADYLVASGLYCERIPAGATLDRGDLWFPRLDLPTVDVKDHATPQLGQWVDRAAEQAENANREVGVVFHKRRGRGNPADWFVTCSGAAFVALMRGK